MPTIDLPLAELKSYLPPLTREDDFASFWDENRRLSAEQPLNPELTPYDHPAVVSVYKVFYDGFGGGRICGWYLVPKYPMPAQGYPAMIVAHGYSGSKGQPADHFAWVLQGFAVLALDTRGQSGEGVDSGTYSFGARPGYLTKGILDKNEYYYRQVYMDHVRGMDFLHTRPEIDRLRIGATGGSQGGALALAMAALDGRFAAAAADMPALCHFRRTLELSNNVFPLAEIAEFIMRWPDREEQVYRTLSYFDNMNWAGWITCPVLVSVGLQDVICTPSTIFAAYNRLAGRKEIRVFPYHGHEGISWHNEEKMRWAKKYILDR